MSELLDKIPRGIRNNNPLNLRKGIYWKGLTDEQKDPEFCQFKTMAYGVRAAFRTLKTYIVNRRLNTIALIVARWAPATENNTQAYMAVVCRRSGIPDNRVLSYYDRQVMFSLFQAMCYVENGRELPINVVAQGYELVY